MATRLDTFDFTKVSEIAVSERRSYPWAEWFDGSIWQLEWNKDFDNHPLMMERVIRTRATTNRVKVQLRHVGRDGDPFGFIVLQAVSVTPVVHLPIPAAPVHDVPKRPHRVRRGA
jgi:hypothetical protein